MEKVKQLYLPHAAEKLTEIYGSVVVDLQECGRKILSGEARFASLSAVPHRSFYFVENKGVTIKVLFDFEDGFIVTVVPPEFQSKVADRKNAKIKRRFFRDLEDDED